MITRVELINYMGHKHTILENLGLLPALVGDNDCGKTTIWRAIQTALFHTNFPADAILWGEKSASIIIDLVDLDDDGNIEPKTARRVERTTDGKSSYVRLVKLGYDETLKGVKGVADIVQEFTKFKLVPLDKQSDPENVQFIPSDDQHYSALYSVEGILRRMVNLMSNASVSNAKLEIASDLNKLKKQEAELLAYTKENDRRLDILESAKVLENRSKAMDVVAMHNQVEKDKKELVSLKRLSSIMDTLSIDINKLDEYQTGKDSIRETYRSIPYDELEYLLDIQQEINLNNKHMRQKQAQMNALGEKLIGMRNELANLPEACETCGREL